MNWLCGYLFLCWFVLAMGHLIVNDGDEDSDNLILVSILSPILIPIFFLTGLWCFTVYGAKKVNGWIKKGGTK